MELTERLPPQRPLWMRLQTDGGAIEAAAQVVWTEDPAPPETGIRHGVVFTRITPDQLQALRNLLHRKAEREDARFRVPLEVAVTCHARGEQGLPIRGRTADLSWGGLLLHLPGGFAPGTALRITLHAPGGPLQEDGVVVWAESTQARPQGVPCRYGFRFTTLGWATTLALGLLVKELLESPQLSAPGS